MGRLWALFFSMHISYSMGI